MRYALTERVFARRQLPALAHRLYCWARYKRDGVTLTAAMDEALELYPTAIFQDAMRRNYPMAAARIYEMAAGFEDALGLPGKRAPKARIGRRARILDSERFSLVRLAGIDPNSALPVSEQLGPRACTTRLLCKENFS